MTAGDSGSPLRDGTLVFGRLPEAVRTALARRAPGFRRAETSDAAWDILVRAPIALLVLGPDLPPTEAEAFCRRFRALDRSRFTVILAIRRDAGTEPGRMMAAGADDCLGDPCGIADAEIRLAVAEHRVRERMDRSLADESRRISEAAIRRHAFRDGLTGVLLRAPFLDRLFQEVRVARRYGRRLSLVLLDFDDLARINADHGLAAGDCLLKTVVAALKIRIRESDDWGRLTGDAFGVMLRETDGPGARVAAGRIRASLAERRWETGTGATIPATVSIGGSVFRGGEDTAERMFLRAETLLAEAQAAGGNRFRMEAPESVSR